MLKYSKEKQIQKKSIDVQEYKAITSDESTLQRQCEQLLDFMKIEYYRVPDCIWRFKGQTPATRAILSRYLKGKPDLLILKEYDDIYIKAMAVELKTKKGELTGSQKQWQRKLPLIIVRSFEQFQKELNQFLDEKNNS